ncbi:MAG: nitrite reductase [Flavobacteriales bacterium]|nr:MAG: nitrite reductase [Flavobacteriales bacterium]
MPVIKPTISKAARKDITELQDKIREFQKGEIPEDKFKHFRLTRGVYGQRQVGVQMIRIKLPYGKFTTNQLLKMAEVADKYSNSNLHLTTRQDIQLHYVKVDDAPQLWADLEEEAVTLREACGNTVRNVTASATAGIDPDEPFDVTPYAHAFAHYFLRNPICQDMGRKIKVAFSSSHKDSAYTFMHDIGFIPKIKNGKRGFKVVIGGGLGAQAIIAKTVYNFLSEEQIIPFSEALLRVFDRYGERAKRFKARLKFLIQNIGLEEFLKLVEEERKALKNKEYKVNTNVAGISKQPYEGNQYALSEPSDKKKFDTWLATNVFEQKQKGFFGVNIRVQLGNFSSETARKLAVIVRKHAADDIRATVNQGLLLKFVNKEALPILFNELEKIGLAKPGFNSIHYITACPGSDTCNLAVTNSTGLALSLEEVLKNEYNDLIREFNIKIKISGCMNACGQHMIANIGFHGSSFKNGSLVAPAMQVVLGGGFSSDGEGLIADKVIKVPSKKAPDALRTLLNDYEENSIDGEYFNAYFQRLGKIHFYELLKPLANLNELQASDYIDWGHTENFKTEIGVGECAGITLDVVSTVILQAEEKQQLAWEGLQENAFADAIYNAYSSMVIGAKAMLLSEDIQCNTQTGIIRNFNEHFYVDGKIGLRTDFESLVLAINKNEPTKEFAQDYIADSSIFLRLIKRFREKQIQIDKSQEEKLVLENHYKA